MSVQGAQKRISSNHLGLLLSHVALKGRHKRIPTGGDRAGGDRGRGGGGGGGGGGGRGEGRSGRCKVQDSATESYATHQLEAVGHTLHVLELHKCISLVSV